MAEVELTILMPCLNEEQTVVQCIQLAQQFLEESGVCGEVLVADNGSSDNSAVLAEFERETIAARVKDAYSTKAVETGFYQGGKRFFGFYDERIVGKTTEKGFNNSLCR